LSIRLQEIYIDGKHLNFGEIKFYYSETEDFLDQCIANNSFPEIDTFICPICKMDLGLVEGDDEDRYMKHMKKEHEVKQKKMNNVFPFLLLGQPSFSYHALILPFMNMMQIGHLKKNVFYLHARVIFKTTRDY
jgi:hypothetical protein